MFEALMSEEDAIAILKEDHKKVKDLFDQFEKSGTHRQKLKIAAQAIQELKIHATIEEEIFYPAVRGAVEAPVMNEADEEHHVAKFLIAELDGMQGTESHYEAKFTVLAENVRHHIKEEENDMLPKARNSDIDFEALGRTLMARKKQLSKDGVPPSAEEKMLGHHRMRAPAPRRKSVGSSKSKWHAAAHVRANGHDSRRSHSEA